MVSPRSCQRCGGALVTGSRRYDEDFCVNCGWRRLDLPDNVLGEYLDNYGDSQIEDGYKARNTIGTGQPALSGHERRQREARNRK